MERDSAFAERLREEARRIDAVFTEAKYLCKKRLKTLAIWRRALSEAIPLYEAEE